MLLSTRAYSLASTEKDPNNPASPFLRWSSSWKEKLDAQRQALKMLLVHQTGSVKVGEVVRYTVTYTPSVDRILPSPTHLHIKIRNTAAIALRAAYLHGPYTFHAAAYPSTFDPNEKTKSPKNEGVPQFEPNVKAGGSFSARIPIPEEIRVTGHSQPHSDGQQQKSITWTIEITSQIIFSSSASTGYELLMSRDEKSLDYSFSATNPGQGDPGKIHDHQQGPRRHGNHAAQPKGIYSKAISVVLDDTTSLWNKPELPEPQRSRRSSRISLDLRRTTSQDKKKSEPEKRKKRKIHLVILTHGLHSNLSADMLYLKESIDATAKHARENARKRRKEAQSKPGTAQNTSGRDGTDGPSTAPLSGGQEDLQGDSEWDEDEEEIIVRGYTGNAVKTESGIQYLGKRLAKWILELTFPDQPYKPLHKSMSKKLSDKLSSKSNTEDEAGNPTHNGSTIRIEDSRINDLAYTFTSISFIGHSLGGLIQLYAIGYIQKHAPLFFDQIKPVNFICLSSPLLGLSNENPMYVKFALDFGLVGRTGQDLGLTWRPPTLAKSGWTAMMGGLGASHKDQPQEDPGAKPLLRILPTGPAHRVLRMFRNRTVYSNVVNDGIVPLRTSCLLFLDWRGLGRVQKARRENGLIGTMVGWGWAEFTGQSASSNPSQVAVNVEDMSQADSDAPENPRDMAVPQPSDDATHDNEEQLPPISPVAEQQFLSLHHPQSSKPGFSSQGFLGGLINYIRPSGKTTKTDMKMFKRSQTMPMDDESQGSSSRPQSQARSKSPEAPTGRPQATRGDSILDDPSNALAPPKTTIFESASDILNPPVPPTSWIIDPASRTRTIFHDRVYHPEDIPPPPTKRVARPSRTPSSADMSQNPDSSKVTMAESTVSDTSNMRVEEKIARAYHKDLSWRKVLVRLEPDAHNNMIVRRMFGNAYGWPVVKHLCDTHFGDTYAATTRDEDEPTTDRAKGLEKPVGDHGEHVKGQEDVKPPPRPASEMREAADELAPLRDGPSIEVDRPKTSLSNRSTGDSWDESYFDTDDEDVKGPIERIERFWNQPPLFKGQKEKVVDPSTKKASAPPKQEEEQTGTTQAEIAEFLTSTPPPIEGHRGLGHSSVALSKSPDSSVVPTEEKGPPLPARSPTDIGLKKSVGDLLGSSSPAASPTKTKEDGQGQGVTETVAKN
ncbi:DUF676-domain-containing protein [Tothia fuscella]|uniref:DUF676-domain-containing protein n=1 Tax=Tothia fuscella TaxID=1048955 RepID=A0A9P4NWA0_9PEZI|nr:DUF676-domain-containing protein [Tothia fuscella]